MLHPECEGRVRRRAFLFHSPLTGRTQGPFPSIHVVRAGAYKGACLHVGLPCLRVWVCTSVWGYITYASALLCSRRQGKPVCVRVSVRVCAFTTLQECKDACAYSHLQGLTLPSWGAGTLPAALMVPRAPRPPGRHEVAWTAEAGESFQQSGGASVGLRSGLAHGGVSVLRRGEGQREGCQRSKTGHGGEARRKNGGRRERNRCKVNSNGSHPQRDSLKS